MTLISGVGVPAGAVFDTMELQNDPSFENADHAGDGAPNGPSRCRHGPCASTASPRGSRRRRCWARHNAEVLNAWLGMGADDVAALKSDGVPLAGLTRHAFDPRPLRIVTGITEQPPMRTSGKSLKAASA